MCFKFHKQSLNIDFPPAHPFTKFCSQPTLNTKIGAHINYLVKSKILIIYGGAVEKRSEVVQSQEVHWYAHELYGNCTYQVWSVLHVPFTPK